MRAHRTLATSLATVICGTCAALEVGKKPDLPQLPGVPYVVHDGTRPQPNKVQTSGAVVVNAPSDAHILFNGKDASAWNNGERWTVRDGALVVGKGAIRSKKTFGDCQLHLEYRVPAGRQVRGQKGGNSGVFLMERYEIQIGEAHTNLTYPDGQSGAIYGQFPPLVNPQTQQGEWQSYDIIFRAPRYDQGKVETPARVTVLFNGVAVQIDQPLYGPTVHQKLAVYPADHPEKGPIKLQEHGDPIEFRNIWVRELDAYDE